MSFEHFDKDAFYELHLRGGHSFTLVVRKVVDHNDGDYIMGRRVSRAQIHTVYPDKNVREIIDDKDLMTVRMDSIDASSYLGKVKDFEEADA